MKENNEVMNANTKENIKEVKDTIKKVADKKPYKVGDQVKAYGKDCKIVEVLEPNRFHVKNMQEPWDSFVVLQEEFE